MTQTQLESALTTWASNIIDVWFADNALLAPVFKTIIKANMYRIRDLVQLVTDSDGNILIDELLDNYEQYIPAEGLRLDAKKLLGDNMITRNISIKILERGDIQQLKQIILNQ